MGTLAICFWISLVLGIAGLIGFLCNIFDEDKEGKTLIYIILLAIFGNTAWVTGLIWLIIYFIELAKS
jgi:hypothetical protein